MMLLLQERAAQLADLIEKCTDFDPSKRLTPALAIKHPLFQ